MSAEKDEQTPPQEEIGTTYTASLNDEPTNRRSDIERRKRSSSISDSFTNFVQNAPASEVEVFSAEIQDTLDALPKTVTESLTKVGRRPSGEMYPAVRRTSRKGSVGVLSMKETAMAALLELGDISDSDDEGDTLVAGKK